MLTESEILPQNDFVQSLQDIYQQHVSSDALGKARARAWDHFLELGLPTRRDEAFQYIRLHALTASNYGAAPTGTIDDAVLQSHVLPECEGAVLAFVNGAFSLELSDLSAIDEVQSGRMVVAPLSEAVRTYGAFLNNRWKKSVKEECDPFAALNAAAHAEAAFVYVPPKTVVERPIQILHLIDSDGPAVVMPRIQGFVGSSAQLNMVNTTAVLPCAAPSEQKVWNNQVSDFSVDDNAHVTLTQVTLDADLPTWHFDAVRAQVKGNGSFTATAVTTGSETVRNSYAVQLLGENANATLNGLLLLSGRKEAHAHILIDHQAPHCDSRQLFKHALADASRSSFEGKILVRRPAQKTDAFQLNNNLLLSDKAHADSKPNLEIFADDVKASHGATFGQLDTDELFYLKTRGFSDSAAKQLLVNGFAKEIVDLVTIPSIQERALRSASTFLCDTGCH